MSTRIPLILIVALATALIAAGCGDDDDEDTTTTATEETTTATGATGAEGASSEFAQQADEICAEGDREIEAEAQEIFGGSQQEPPQAEQERFAEDVLIPNVEQQIEDVAALTPPEGQEEQFDEFIDEARSAIDELKADPSLAISQGGENPFAETNQMARELGLQVCGQS